MSSRFINLVRTTGAAILFTFALFTAAQAQNTLTPEGTVITNTASVSYTDVNGDTYTPATGSVDVTVGFLPGIDVTATVPHLDVPAGTNNHELPFTVCNTGNGTDQFVISDNIADVPPPTMTNIRWVWNGNTYTSLVDLNAAMVSYNVLQGACETITVVFDVPAGSQGGEDVTYTLTATSNRDGTVFDSDASTISTIQSGTISVTPDDAPLPAVPNGTYTTTYTLTNNQSGMDDFDIAMTMVPAGVTILGMSVDGCATYTTEVLDLAAGGSQEICVKYSVSDVAAGSLGKMELTATSQFNASITDPGSYILEAIRPALEVTKEAFRADGTTPILSGDKVLPGETIVYKVTIKNTGTADAKFLTISDPIPAELNYVSAAPDANPWVFSPFAGTVEAKWDGPLGAGLSSYITITATVK